MWAAAAVEEVVRGVWSSGRRSAMSVSSERLAWADIANTSWLRGYLGGSSPAVSRSVCSVGGGGAEGGEQRC